MFPLRGFNFNVSDKIIKQQKEPEVFIQIIFYYIVSYRIMLLLDKNKHTTIVNSINVILHS